VKTDTFDHEVTTRHSRVAASTYFVLALAAAPAFSQVPPPTQGPSQRSDSWQISVISVTAVNPDSMPARSNHQVLRVNLSIQYVGPSGEVMAVAPRLQDSNGGSYRMLGELAPPAPPFAFALLVWVMSGSKEAQETLHLTSGQSIGEWGFFFEVPATVMNRLSLIFGDVPPVRVLVRR